MDLKARVQGKGVQLRPQQDVLLCLVGKDEPDAGLILLVLQDGLRQMISMSGISLAVHPATPMQEGTQQNGAHQDLSE